MESPIESLKVYEQLHKIKAFKESMDYYRTISQLRKGKVTLDIACGEGWVEFWNSDQIYGIDFSVNALKKAKQNSKASFIQADACHLPFPSGIFEMVVCLGSLEHFRDAHVAIQESSRVLKKSGLILLTVDIKRFFLHPVELYRRFLLPLRGLRQPERNPSKGEVDALISSRFNIVFRGVYRSTRFNDHYLIIGLRREK